MPLVDVYYVVPDEDDADETHPNVFTVASAGREVRLADVRAAFPLGGDAFHFRFRRAYKSAVVWWDALDEAGIPFDPELVTHCEHNEEVTVGAVGEMLALPDPATAVLTTETDAMVGTLRAIRAAGLAHPRDVSVIGFDDSSWASVMEPPLTMIAQPMLELGRAAAQHAFARIAGDDGDVVVESIPTTFIPRESVAAARTPVSAADAR